MVSGRGDIHSNILTLLILALTLLAGCSNNAEPDSRNRIEPEPPPVEEPTPAQAGLELVPIGEQILNKAAISVEQLLAIIDQFLDDPNDETYELVRFAWLASIHHIEPFALFAQIQLAPSADQSATQALFEQPFQRLACWPVEPGFLDGFGEHPYSGIVFDISTPLSAASLRSQHQITSLTEATIGLYALGILLFGPNDERSMSDFEAQLFLSDEAKLNGYQNTSELPNNRRRKLIQLQVSLIADDLAKLHSLLTSKKPDGFSTLMDKQPRSQQVRIVHQAVKDQFAKQLLALAEFQKRHRADLLTWQQHVFAKRLNAQLNGWLQIAEQLPLPEKEFLLGESRHAGEALANIIAKPVDSTVENEQVHAQWSLVFQHLRQVSARLNQSQIN